MEEYQEDNTRGMVSVYELRWWMVLKTRDQNLGLVNFHLWCNDQGNGGTKVAWQSCLDSYEVLNCPLYGTRTLIGFEAHVDVTNIEP